MKTRALGALLLAGAVIGGSDARGAEPDPAGSRVQNPFRGVMQDRSAHSAEERLFVEKCGMCHRQMGMGTVILARRMDPKVAALEARSDLRAEYVTIAVRAGIGNMPRISRGEVSESQLTRIAAYLAKARLQ
jgi:mono/diheme cytochrome c family protein